MANTSGSSSNNNSHLVSPVQDSQSERRKRGHTRGIGLEKERKKNKNMRLPVIIDPNVRQAVGTYAPKFNNECGYIARNFLPLDVSDWRNVPEEEKEVQRHRLEENFDINVNSELVKDVIDYQMNKSWKQFKYNMHKHFKEVGGENDHESAKLNKPERIHEQETWNKLCDMWGEDVKKTRCEKNAENRSKRSWQSTSGSISAPNHHIRSGLAVDDPTGAIQTFHNLHHDDERGWKSDAARTAYEAMKQMREEHPYIPEDENSMTDLDIMESILGRRPCYRKGWSRKLPYRLQVSDSSKAGGSELDLEARIKRIEELYNSQSQGSSSTTESQQEVNNMEDRISRIEALLSQQQLQSESHVQDDRLARIEETLSQLVAQNHPTQEDFKTMCDKTRRMESIITKFVEQHFASEPTRPTTRNANHQFRR